MLFFGLPLNIKPWLNQPSNYRVSFTATLFFCFLQLAKAAIEGVRMNYPKK
jgi:hypothetical protein